MLEAIVEAYFKHSTDVESAKPSEIWKNLTVQKEAGVLAVTCLLFYAAFG